VTCKDCIHYKVCCQKHLHVVTGMDFVYRYKYNHIERVCKDFKDRSRFVELPIIDDYGEAKLLDIAIDYCYKVAMSSDPNICVEYKAEHMRLCGWLGDLRRRIEAEQALKERKT